MHEDYSEPEQRETVNPAARQLHEQLHDRYSRRPGRANQRCLMVTAFEIMPVLAMAMAIVLIPVVGNRPERDDTDALRGRRN
jgi:hypothetical protein